MPTHARRSRPDASEPLERRLLMSTYTVNTASDAASPGAGLTTFRQAVAMANAHRGADTVAFSPATFPAGTGATIRLPTPIAFTDTTGSTTVTGPGRSALSVSGRGDNRLVTMATGTTVSLSGLTLTDDRQTAATDAAGDVQGGGPLADTVGPTATELPRAGSPLIDAGNTALVPAGLTIDQRLLPRVVGTAVDMGAAEYVAVRQ